MKPRKLKITSNALGEIETVTVLIYDTVQQMRDAASEFNGSDQGEALGVTQAWVDGNLRADRIVIRLARGHLGTQIVTHELHHATTAIYGAHVGDRISRVAHLNHYNEPFAHLFSDMARDLVDQLHAAGYYDEAAS